MASIHNIQFLITLFQVKQDKNTSDLPKLAGYSCEEAYKSAMVCNFSLILSQKILNVKMVVISYYLLYEIFIFMILNKNMNGYFIKIKFQ